MSISRVSAVVLIRIFILIHRKWCKTVLRDILPAYAEGSKRPARANDVEIYMKG
jgi:hypothetical protein